MFYSSSVADASGSARLHIANLVAFVANYYEVLLIVFDDVNLLPCLQNSNFDA